MVVVGEAGYDSAGNEHAFRWTEETGMVDLGTLPGRIESFAYGVSGDGSVIVGHCQRGGPYRAFRWTQAGGMQSVNDWLGVPISTVAFKSAYGVSANGNAVVGQMPNNHAIIARGKTSVPGAPTEVKATAGDAQATVSFKPPASDGGSPIKSYTATSSPGSKKATGTSSPIVVTGLTNGTAYTFTVKATNAMGTSPASTKSNQVTPKVPASITFTSPNGGQSWKAGTTHSISWNYTGNPGTTVMIELLKGTSSSVIKLSNSTGSSGKGTYSWTIPTEQAPGSNYKVRVTSRTKPSCKDASNSNFTIR
jgi:probable HAF family extracellular repeat protein